MYLNFLFLCILIIITDISYIYASESEIDRIKENLINNSETNYKLRKIKTKIINNYIILKKTDDNLYFFDINIGTPSQSFSVLLDTGSNFFWVTNDKCDNCNSKSKFIPEKSRTFISTNKPININYISGDLFGTISNDIIKFDNNKKIIDFNYILINESSINLELDGIFGLSKNIKDFNNSQYSPINQIFRNDNFDKKIFTLDFIHYNFYIGERPLYLNLYDNITCERKSIVNLNNYYWKCISKKLIFINENNYNINIPKENNIIFNSGINSIVFSYNYISLFKKIISNNELLNESKCEIKETDDNVQIHSILCGKINKNSELFTNKFISIYFDNNKKEVSLNLESIYDKVNNNFKLYFIDIPDNTIILGIPFFEKNIIMLNKETDEIIIYNNPKEVKYGEEVNKKLIAIIFIVIMILFIVLIIYYIYYQKYQISLYKLVYQM